MLRVILQSFTQVLAWYLHKSPLENVPVFLLNKFQNFLTLVFVFF